MVRFTPSARNGLNKVVNVMNSFIWLQLYVVLFGRYYYLLTVFRTGKKKKIARETMKKGETLSRVKVRHHVQENMGICNYKSDTYYKRIY